MNCNIKFTSKQIPDLQNIIDLMYHVNLNYLDYFDFWSIGKLLQKVSIINYKSNFFKKKNYTVVFTPDEINSFISLVKKSKNLLEKSPYYNTLILEITRHLHKHILEMEHRKEMFVGTQNLTIPKLLDDE